MDFEKLLQNKETEACDCGKVHTCTIRKVIIAPGAIMDLEGELAAYQHILLVADNNTYQTCGRQVSACLKERLADTLIYQQEGLLIPNEEAITRMEQHLTDHTDLIIGIGSGVIQDLCKYVSFQAGLPYYIIATAPSMDGYASKGAAMIIGNMKVTYNAHVPEVIIGDIDILKEAPMRLIQSGYGDILGKYSCLNDWKLSRVVNEEYFCQAVYNLTYDMLLQTKDLGPRLLTRDPDAIGTLMEALIGVGIAMAYVGNSRPASGSEHHLSHFFEVTGLLNDEPYFMHGIDVAYSAVYTQKLREELLSLPSPQAHILPDRASREQTIRSIYGAASEGVLALQDKLGWYDKDRLPVYQAKWQEIRDVLREAPSSTELLSYLLSAGLDIAEFQNTYSPQKIQDALWYAKDLKDRYSILWMYYVLKIHRYQ